MSRFCEYGKQSVGIRILFSVNIGLLLFFPIVLKWFYQTGTPFDKYFLWFNYVYYDFLRTHLDSIAIILLSSFFSAFVFFCLRINTKFSAWIVDSILFLSLVLILNILRVDFFNILSRKTVFEHSTLFSLGSVVLIIFGIRFRKNIIAFSRLSVLLVTPVTLLMVFNLIWAGVLLAPEQSGWVSYSSLLERTKDTERPKKRVVWMIFDELDYRFLFEYPRSDVELSNFQKLKNEAFMATNATPPANMTFLSMPALTTGLNIKGSTEVPRGDFILTLDGSKKISWKRSSNIFSKANKLGARVAIYGDKQSPPYCKLFHKQADACWEQAQPWLENNSAIKRIPIIWRELLKAIPGARNYFEEKERLYHPNIWANSNIEFTKGIQKALSNAGLDFTFIHVTVPHTPIFYNRIENDYRKDSNSLEANYFDNLELADKMFGKFRAAMEKSALWNKTNVIISADHSCRNNYCSILKDLNLKQDPRVPFIVKLSNQKTSAFYSQPINTIQTERLIIELLKRDVKAHEIPTILAK